MKGECEYPDCEKKGLRHLMGRYYCHDHRLTVVRKAEDSGELLYNYVKGEHYAD